MFWEPGVQECYVAVSRNLKLQDTDSPFSHLYKSGEVQYTAHSDDHLGFMCIAWIVFLLIRASFLTRKQVNKTVHPNQVK